MTRGGANLTRVNFALEAGGIADMAAEPAATSRLVIAHIQHTR